VEPTAAGVVANICERKLILCFANIQIFCNFFKINEVSNGEWVAPFVQPSASKTLS
jgi:hypothetical protein